jgi:hypothetical protein
MSLLMMSHLSMLTCPIQSIQWSFWVNRVWTKLAQIESDSLQIQDQIRVCFFIWISLTFGQSVEYKSCAKYSTLPPEKVSYFLRCLSVFPDFLPTSTLNRNLFWKNTNPYFLNRPNPRTWFNPLRPKPVPRHVAYWSATNRPSRAAHALPLDAYRSIPFEVMPASHARPPAVVAYWCRSCPLDSVVVPHLTSRVLTRPLPTSPTSQAPARLSQFPCSSSALCARAIGTRHGVDRARVLGPALTARFAPLGCTPIKGRLGQLVYAVAAISFH